MAGFQELFLGHLRFILGDCHTGNTFIMFYIVSDDANAGG